ncbi:MAG: signal recognition particle protein [Campylobacterales bacterium]
MFESLTESFKHAINRLRHTDDERALKGAIEELKKSLLKSDVHHKLLKELLTQVEHKTKEKGIGKSQFIEALKEVLLETLEIAGHQGFVFADRPPTVVMMAGLQGSGKTTTSGKLALYLKQRGKKVLLAAADLQRLAAVEQLKQIGSQIEVEVLALDGVSEPLKVAEAALKRAKDGLFDVLIVDTAGRLAIDEALMDELAAVKRLLAPHEVFYVADSLTGQDGVRSAVTFHEKIGLTGIILSKFDGDSKGGVALGIAKQTGVPLRFIGTGEKMPDLELFVPERIVGRLLGAGDVVGLAEKVGAVINEKDAKKINQKIRKGEFNFEDFIEQLETVKKLGNLKNLIGMVPGMSGVAQQIGDVDLENMKEIKRIRAMINSMTPKERQQPSLLNNSRKRRIAKGAGLSQVEVNRILNQFEKAAKIAKKFSSKSGMKDLAALMSQHRFPGFGR